MEPMTPNPMIEQAAMSNRRAVRWVRLLAMMALASSIMVRRSMTRRPDFAWLFVKSKAGDGRSVSIGSFMQAITPRQTRGMRVSFIGRGTGGECRQIPRQVRLGGMLRESDEAECAAAAACGFASQIAFVIERVGRARLSILVGDSISP